jgi:hypothetical protein
MKKYEVAIFLTRSQMNRLKKNKGVRIKMEDLDKSGEGFLDFLGSIF